MRQRVMGDGGSVAGGEGKGQTTRRRRAGEREARGERGPLSLSTHPTPFPSWG